MLFYVGISALVFPYVMIGALVVVLMERVMGNAIEEINRKLTICLWPLYLPLWCLGMFANFVYLWLKRDFIDRPPKDGNCC